MEKPRMSGTAAAVSITMGTHARLYLEREVVVDRQGGVVYVSDSRGELHEITAPLSATVIQWIAEAPPEQQLTPPDQPPSPPVVAQ